ncbi:4-demethylwyosine synthase TYW1 [Methanobacterium alcaliphilum]|uniref:4-demethylwyosine synthase TYW1 n=1 Tax=Methanobacterium alcaliphilum TaxID=392018 RepID=UPI002009E634|nr:4-demethylwyosine synthase TYW1 [Methanobacterium alcaliphilum]MCK9150449.1 4-demethylwyosine synthase TYW1 [Methanobacterium alcaliphilum]
MSFSIEEKQKLEKMGYRFVGNHNHAAAKICHWTKKSILDEGFCYKQKFYGIESHRCLQMSPSIPFCHQKCSFCWRDLSATSVKWEGHYDDPGAIIDGCIEAQRKLLCGFFGNAKSNLEKLDESQDPTNAAISLAGEPMLYPEIGDLISEFHRRKFTTFLVSNGLEVEKLKNLPEEPTQLYLSLDAPEKQTFNNLCKPQVNDAWDRLNQSLELMPSFDSRTVIRTTCVKGENMKDHQSYADLIKKADPDFVEIKAYMFVGYSRQRMQRDNMPSLSDVEKFALEIGELCGMKILDKMEDSRVVLLG